jgi:hypothetical protein
MTSIHETIRTEEIAELKTNYEKSQVNIPEFSTYNSHVDNFQKQVEKTVIRRFELFCNLYLEQIKFCGNVAKVSTDSQQKFLAKLGLKIDTQSEFQDMFDAWSNGVRNRYSDQTRHIEIVLNMLHQNMRMTNSNMNEFAKIIWSSYSWWIPPNQKPLTTS